MLSVPLPIHNNPSPPPRVKYLSASNKCIVNIFQNQFEFQAKSEDYVSMGSGQRDSSWEVSRSRLIGQSFAVTCPQVQLCGRKKGKMTLPVWGTGGAGGGKGKTKREIMRWRLKAKLIAKQIQCQVQMPQKQKAFNSFFGHNTIHIFGWILINFWIFLCSKNSSKRK